MSRVGKNPILLPEGVTATVKGSEVTVKGPKGELVRSFDPEMVIALEDGTLSVSPPEESRQRRHRELHGLTRSLINNMVIGVTEGYERRLQIVGTGYRAEELGEGFKVSLGFSHDIHVVLPPGMSCQIEDRGQTIILTAIDKAMIGQVAADIRKLRPPEPYQGKGVRYWGEYVKIKPGKAGKVGA